VQGAGDDSGNWSRGLTPALFWQHARALLCCKEDTDCDRMVEHIVQRHAASSAVSDGATAGAIAGDQKLLPLSIQHIGSTGIAMAVSACSYEQLPRQLTQLPSSAAVILFDPAGSSADIVTTPPGPELKSSSADSASGCQPPGILRVHYEENVKKDKTGFERALHRIIPFIAPALRPVPVTASSSPAAADRHSTVCVLLVGSSLELLVCSATAILCNSFDSSYQLRPAATPGTGSPAAHERASKDSIRQALLFVQSHSPPVFPSRQLVIQLNRFFLSYSSSASLTGPQTC